MKNSNYIVDLTAELPNNEQLKAKVAEYYQGEIENLEAILTNFKHNNLIKSGVDCKILALRFIGMLEGLKKLLLYGLEPEKIKQLWSCFADAILKEIKP
jgi:hypothetical protein